MSLIRKKQDDVSIDGVDTAKVEFLAASVKGSIGWVREAWDRFTPEEKAQLLAWSEKTGMKIAQKAGREMLMGDGNSAIQTVFRTLAELNSKHVNIFMTEIMKGLNNG